MDVVSDLEGQPTFADNADEADALNWEQVQVREAERETAWELVPTGRQWRKEPRRGSGEGHQGNAQVHAPQGAGWRGADSKLQRALHCPDDGGQCG